MKTTAIILASLMGHALAAPASAESNAPAPGSPEDICLEASVKVFDKCFQTPRRDEPPESLSERCKKEREDAKKDCLDVKVVNETVVDGHDARKKQAECDVPANRAFHQCMRDRVLKNSGETREDCERERKNASEACMKGEKPKPANPSESESTGQTIDQYCQVMGATSNALFDKQFCLDAFKSCGNPASLDDTKAQDCANKIMEDKYLGREPRPVPGSKKEDESTEQPNTPTQNCQ